MTASTRATSASRIDDLLDAAEWLIAERSSALTVRDIAARASLGAATLYEHLPSKDELLRRVVERLQRDEAARERELLGQHSDAPTASLLALLVRHRARRALARGPLLVGLLDLPTTQELVAPRGALAAPAHAGLLGALRGRSDLAPGLTADEAADLLSVALRGALLAALEERPQYLDDEAFLAEITATLEHLVLASPRPFRRLHAASHAHRWHDRRPTRAVWRKEPSQSRSRALVEAILGGVERLLARPGAASLTTPHIAEAAGVSVGSLYQYFADRDAILGVLIDRWIEHDLAFLSQVLAALPGSLPEATEEGLLRAHRRIHEHARIYRTIFLWMRRLERHGPAQDFLGRAQALLVRHASGRQGAAGLDLELLFFVQLHVWASLSRSLLPERPGLFLGPSFEASLRRWTRALARRSPLY